MSEKELIVVSHTKQEKILVESSETIRKLIVYEIFYYLRGYISFFNEPRNETIANIHERLSYF